MIRIICDRCGKEIPAAGVTGYLAWNFRNGYKGDLIQDNVLESMDYCETCMGAIFDFISAETVPDSRSECAVTVSGPSNAGKLEIDDPEVKRKGGRPEKEKNSCGRQKTGKPGKRTVDEGKVIALINAGRSARWIADDMGISQQSVYNVLNRIRKQTGG